MKLNNLVIPLILANLLLTVGFIHAEGENKTAKNSARKKMVTIKGTVSRTRQTDVLRGRDVKHTIVEVKTDSDKRGKVIADLGPTRHLRLPVATGKEITLKGRFVDIGKYKRVLMASHIQTNGRSANISRSGRSLQKIKGKIKEKKLFKLRDQKGSNSVLLLDTNRGVYWVDVGPSRGVQGLALVKGAQVTARGQTILVNRIPVLLAFEIKAGDKTKKVKRTRPRNTKKRNGERPERAGDR